MSQRPHARDEEEVGDRILSDFTTQPETAGFTHGTWALAIMAIGVALVAAPMVLPWYASIPAMAGVIGVVWFVFSATPPHLSPGQFVRYRVQYHVSQQVFVRKSAHASVRRQSQHEAGIDYSTLGVSDTDTQSSVATPEAADD